MPPICTTPGQILFPTKEGADLGNLRVSGVLAGLADRAGEGEALEEPAGVVAGVGQVAHQAGSERVISCHVATGTDNLQEGDLPDDGQVESGGEPVGVVDGWAQAEVPRTYGWRISDGRKGHSVVPCAGAILFARRDA